jgi:hypothetical protein
MEETNRIIVNDLIQAYKNQYGEDNWATNLTRNLRPSPNQAIADKYGVSKNRVIRLKHELWKLGVITRELVNLPEQDI